MLTIVIPARNEEKRIERTLDAYLNFYRDRRTLIMVVVNNSTDETAAICEARMEHEPGLFMIDVEQAVGKGGAVHLGFAEANSSVMGFVDADGATSPEAFYELVEYLDAHPDADGVIASRWLKASKVLTPQSLSRRIASRLFNFAIRVLFRLPYRDTQCGAKLFRGKAIKEVLPQLTCRGWLFDVELLVRMRQAAKTVSEIPTTWQDVDGSQFSLSRNVGTVAKELWQLWRRVRK